MLRPVCVAFLIITPIAAASGVLEAGPVVVMIVNGHETDCVEDLTGLCIAAMRGSDAGETEADANQRVRFVGVAANRTFVNELVGHALLPDGSMMLTPSEYEVEHPVFRILIDVVGVKRGFGPADGLAVLFTDDGFGFEYFGPGLNPVNTTSGTHGAWMIYGKEGAEEGLIERDRVRPQQDFNSTSVDERLDDIPTTRACQEDLLGCEGTLAVPVESAKAATPNVIIGAAFVQALVTTDPENFPTGDGVGPRETPSVPLGGRSALGPPTPLPRSPTPTPSLEPNPPGGPARPKADPWREPIRPDGQLSTALRATTPPPTGPALDGALAVTVAFVVAVLLAVLYSRVLGREDALVTRRRHSILNALEAGPMTLSDLTRSLGVDRTTVAYHARMLQKASKLVVTRLGRRVVLSLPGVEEPQRAVTPHAREVIFQLITTNGGILARSKLHELTAEIPLRTRNRVLKELSNNGLIECVQGAGEPMIRAVPTTTTRTAVT